MDTIVESIKHGEDVLGAVLIINGERHEMYFAMDMEERLEAIEEVVGITLDLDARLCIERLSLEQMNREALRVLAVLKDMAPSAVGCVTRKNGGYWHVRADKQYPNDLSYSESFGPDCQPGDLAFGVVSDIDSISAVEMFEAAEELRGWVRSPAVEHYEPDWLAAIS